MNLKEIKKGTLLAEGGEGFIYELNNKLYKIFKPDISNSELKNKEYKLKYMMNLSLPKNIILPLNLIYDNGEFIGFEMEKIDGEELKSLSNFKFCKNNQISLKEILYLFINIKNTIKVLHQNNIIIGDLNDRNILFDFSYNSYFIDVDSFSIGNLQSTVCMESFKDPFSNVFSKNTDNYAFSILLFKSITRVHPFGGILNPDISLLKRMIDKFSIIDKSNIGLPEKIMRPYKIISPDLKNDFLKILEGNDRFLIDSSLENLNNNLSFCKIHNEFYYKNFSDCPICNQNIQLKKTIDKLIKGTGGILKDKIFYENLNGVYFINDNLLDLKNYVLEINSNTKIEKIKGYDYLISKDGNIIVKFNKQNIEINYFQNKMTLKKSFKSQVYLIDNKLYYITEDLKLLELLLTSNGSSSTKISNVSLNCIFNIKDKTNYFIINQYSKKKILEIDGYFYELNNNDKIINNVLCYDALSKTWLFIYENQKGEFYTLVFSKNKLLFENNQIKYINDLQNITFNGNIIYKTNNSNIIGYSYEKNIYKEFFNDKIKDNMKILRKDDGFLVFDDNKILYIFK